MKKTINFFLNGTEKEISVGAETTVLELLRGSFILNGIKEGCGEGDCGACTVVIGEVVNGKVHYKSAAGCLYLAAKLEGKHLITIEGMADKEKLHPIQQAILEAHATQCGFCTPGVSLSILALYLENENPTKEEFRRYLEGNLCRCTGYASIKKVPEYLNDLIIDMADIRMKYLSAVEKKQLEFRKEDILIDNGEKAYYSPVTEAGLTEFLGGHPEYRQGTGIRFLNGGSDIVVGIKKRNQHFRLLIDLSRLEKLQELRTDNGTLKIGGGVTLARIINETREIFPELADTILRMCSEQVRSLATMSGNIVNASPVADTVPLLMAIGAEIILMSTEGTRAVPIKDFFHGYKNTENRPDEWVSSVSIPLGEYNFIHFEKVSKRRDVDISSVNSALALQVEDGIIRKAGAACGGVGATTLYMKETSEFLTGKGMCEDTFYKSFAVIDKEASPISDVRGSAEYRKALLQNLLIKHYLAYKSKTAVE